MDIPRMLEGGLDAQFFACFPPPRDVPEENIKSTLDMIDALHRVAESDERFVIVDSADDILDAKSAGKIACILAIEGGHAIAGDLRVLRNFRRLGVRYMTLTHNNNNDIGDSSDPDQSRYGDIPLRGGLTEFGREVVKEMNRVGMIVDLSHVHVETFNDVMETSTKPVIASHSCCYAINPHHRNLNDDQLRALARNGGVVGINYFSSFLSAEHAAVYLVETEEERAKLIELREKYKDDEAALYQAWREIARERRERAPKVPIAVLVDHIDHVAKVAGVDHVGLGSDFDGISASPEGLEDVTDLYTIVIELHRRGYGETDIRKILGGNFLRVIRANDVD
jgi:membrane dipeptidase